MDMSSTLFQVMAGASILVLTMIVFIALFLASIYLMAYLSKSETRHFYRY